MLPRFLVPRTVVTVVLGVAIVICVIVKMIEDNEFQTGWAWVCFALALAIMLTAFVRVRFRWETRHRRPDDERPRAAPELGTGAGSWHSTRLRVSPGRVEPVAERRERALAVHEDGQGDAAFVPSQREVRPVRLDREPDAHREICMAACL